MNKTTEESKTIDQEDIKVVRGGLRSSIFFGAVALLALLAAGFFFVQYQNERSNSPEEVAIRNQELSNTVVGKLAGVLLLDKNVEPTVATIDNADSLREANADFYADAQDGDYLILYPQRAIIFRENANQVVNIAPIINTGADSTTP